ncbi:MAG: leucine-rich repeat domain-containing protein [Clostridia bacterium]|nr:leucine-rich repeat domain-containing protein [Clostridia bacterium]
MKKIISLLLALLMLSLTMVACSSDEEGTTGNLGTSTGEDEVKSYQPTENNPYADTFTYDYVGKYIAITGFSGSAEKHTVTVPTKIGETVVTQIAEGAFDNCSNIAKIVVPEGIEVIGDNAFTGCAELTEVVLPTTLRSIGVAAFSDCAKLEKVEGLRATAVTTIGAYAFYACEKITALELPDSLAAIATATFADCTGLVSIRIGDEVKVIGAQAFFGCTALELAALPTSVTELGSGAFGNCNAQTMATLKAGISNEMTYPEGVTIDHVFIVVEDAE